MANQVTVKHYPGSSRWSSNVEEEVEEGGSSAALKTEEGATSQGKWVASRSWKGWSPREEGSPAHTPLLAQ